MLGPIWSKRSKESKKLISLMLNKNYEERPSAYEILNCEWIKNSLKYEKYQVGSDMMIDNLTEFHVTYILLSFKTSRKLLSTHILPPSSTPARTRRNS